MTSPLHNRERVDLARSFRTTVFPVGQPVVVRITHKLSSKNRAAVQFRYFGSVANSSSRAGNDDWRGELQPLSALRAFFDRTRGNNPVDLQMVWRLARGLFRTPLKFCQEPRGRFTNRLKALSSAVLHVTKHGANDVAEIRIPRGEIRNVVR
jgi:hypothetical protein